MRDFGVRLKLNPVRSLLEGKRVVLIDDSIVRGTTSRKIVRMVRSAGAKAVHMRISCPPTISPCFYGVDTPSKKELIAANKSVEEIRQFIGADSLSYLSLEGLKKACGDGEKTTYCTACYTGVVSHQLGGCGRNPARHCQAITFPLQRKSPPFERRALELRTVKLRAETALADCP